MTKGPGESSAAFSNDCGQSAKEMNDDQIRSILRDIPRLIDEMRAETDRAAVILGTAHLDTLLYSLLKARLMECAQSRDDLLDQEQPIGTFSARIKLAHRLGLIKPDFAKGLDLLRRIRNAFAHQWDGISLNSGPEKDRVVEIIRIFENDHHFKAAIQESFGGNAEPSSAIRAAIALMAVQLKAFVHFVPRIHAEPALRPRNEGP